MKMPLVETAEQSVVLSVKETAHSLRIAPVTVWRLLREKKLPRTRVGGRTLIRRVDLDAFVSKCVETQVCSP